MFEDLLRFDKEKTYCFFDLETFNLGLSFKQNRPWQFGIVIVKGDNIIDSKDILINWTKETDLQIGDEAARITRYDHQKLLKFGIAPKEAWLIAEEYLNKADFIIGHNILNFDIYLLSSYAQYLNRPWKHFLDKMIDTRALIQGFKLGTPFTKGKDNLAEYQYRMINKVVKGVKTNLTVVAKEYNIDHNYDNLHDAICDLELNVKIWNKIKYQIEI
jgi:DNA polymerase III epsilon subunit-like protein